jgi:hypothetical protein
MDATLKSRRRLALGLVAVLAWFGVLLQLYLSLRLALGGGKSLAAGLVAFLGYFTVLTNIFVALASTLPAVLGRSRVGRWFGTGVVLGCATTAIVLVGAVYHALLRDLWEPEGLQWLADVTLHYAVPMAAFVYWIWFPPSQRLPFWAPLAWCIYPIVCLAYALARGEVIGSYPYHFIDVTSLGYSKVVLNSLGLLLVYVLIGSAVYGIASFRGRTPGGIRAAA